MENKAAQLGEVQLQNLTGIVQSVWDAKGNWGPQGMRWDIQPHEIKAVKALCAREFLTLCPKYVIKYAPTEFPTREGEPKVWVANMTGSPFIEETVVLKRKRKGEWEDYDAPNPLATPQSVEYTVPGDFRNIGSDDSPEVVVDVPKKIILGPYERAPISKSYAEVMLALDSNQEQHHRGKMQYVDPPATFEPHITWPLEWLQTYADMVSAAFPKFQEAPWADYIHNTPEEDETPETEEARSKARTQLGKALFFVSMHSVANKPDEMVFQQNLKRFQAAKKQAQRKGK